MRIIHASDIHGSFTQLALIPELSTSDCLCLSGDLTHFGNQETMEAGLKSIQELPVQLLLVSGNCDYPDVSESILFQKYHCEQKVKSINGYAFIGLGGSLPCPGSTPQEHSDDRFSEILNEQEFKLLPKNFILISHQPPHGCQADRTSTNVHVGSHAIRNFIERYQPKLCLCGHIHEGKSISKIGNCLIINPGAFKDGNYACIDLKDNQVTATLTSSV